MAAAALQLCGSLHLRGGGGFGKGLGVFVEPQR